MHYKTQQYHSSYKQQLKYTATAAVITGNSLAVKLCFKPTHGKPARKWKFVRRWEALRAGIMQRPQETLKCQCL